MVDFGWISGACDGMFSSSRFSGCGFYIDVVYEHNDEVFYL